MRTLTLEIIPFESVRKEMAETFSLVRSYRILETLKTDYREGICIEIMEFDLREGVSMQEVRTVDNIEVLSVLRSNGNRHTCLIKYSEPEETKGNFQESDLGLIHSTPTILSQEKFIISMIGETKNLKTFVDMMRNVGTIENMSFRKAAYQRSDMLDILTDKQREVMVEAYRSGYYDYPKRISSVKLCQKVNVSKPTLLHHLRKAEGRMLKEIMTGY